MRPSQVIPLGEENAGLAPGRFAIEIDGALPPDPSPALLDRWDALRADKPRLFNGPILRYAGFDRTAHGAVARASRDWYRRLTVQLVDPGLVQPPIMQLSVTGVLTALDHAGERHVLVGQRSNATRVYGSMWELAPSGGIDPPPMSVSRLDGFDVFRQLLTEIDEELGLPANPDPGPLLALTIDEHAWSCDAVMLIELVRPIEDIVAHTAPAAGHGWEYVTTRWIPCAEFERFVRGMPCIPPTTALAGLVTRL